MAVKVLFTGPLLDSSGFGEASRILLKTLCEDSRIEVSARHINYDIPDKPYSHAFSNKVKESFSRSITDDIEVFIQCTTCNIEATPKPGVVNVLYTFVEIDKLPNSWIAKANEFDYIILPSHYNMESFFKSGIPINKLILFNLPCDKDEYITNIEPMKFSGVGNRTIFYNINQLSPKKNIDGLLRAYFTAFQDRQDEVLLVLKSYLGMSGRDNNAEYEILKNFVQSIKRGCRLSKTPPVKILNGVLSKDEIKSIHLAGHCYVNSSRAEGWGMGIIDAFGFGNAVITSQYGGPGEFCNESNSYIYGGCESFYFGFDHPDPELFNGKHKWFEPSLVEMSQCMKYFHEFKATYKDSEKQKKGFQLINDLDYRNRYSGLGDFITNISSLTK